jgi:hypothetical protein
MRITQMQIPGLSWWDILANHYNKTDRVRIDGRDRIRVHIPFLNIVFPSASGNPTAAELSATAQGQVDTLRSVSFPSLRAFYLENSYGAFEFVFHLRTSIMDHPREWTGSFAEPIYDANGFLANRDEFEGSNKRSINYDGYKPYVVYEKDPDRFGTTDNQLVANFNAASTTSVTSAALNILKTAAIPSYDDQLPLQKWLDATMTPGDTKSFIFIASPGFSGGALRTRDGGEGFGANLPNGGFEPKDILILDRVLKNFMYSSWRWETFAHELGHSLFATDLYTSDWRGRLGYSSEDSLSLMAHEAMAPHMDGVLKFRWGWLDPQVLHPEPHAREIVLPPVYDSPGNALLIRPDVEGRADEFFLVEHRRKVANRWDGQPTAYDHNLDSDNEGIVIYHVNAVGATESAPMVDVEGEAPGVQALRAFASGTSFGSPGSDFHDGTACGLTVAIGQIDANGRATLRISWDKNPGESETFSIASNGGMTLRRRTEGWRDSWSLVIAGNFMSPDSHDMLVYDRSNGEAEVLQWSSNRWISRRHFSGWRRTWTSIVALRGGSGRHDLLLYDKNAGEALLLVNTSAGLLGSGRSFSGWRRTWELLAAADIGGTGLDELLLYDRVHGEAQILQRNGKDLASVVTFQGWRKTWSHLLLGQFNADAKAELLLYDQQIGEAEMYSFDNSYQMRRRFRASGWRRTWTSVQRVSTSGLDRVLLYDRTAGEATLQQATGTGFNAVMNFDDWRRTWDTVTTATKAPQVTFYSRSSKAEGEIYSVSNSAAIHLHDAHFEWRRSWSHIVAGDFGGSSRADLLFYDPTVGEAETWSVGSSGSMQKLRTTTGWRRTWTHVVPGNFGGDAHGDILLYDPTSQTAAFLRGDGKGGFTTMATHEGLRRTWTHIVPGNFGGDGTTDLLFYDPTAGEIELYTVSGAGKMTRLRRDTVAQTYTQIVAGNFGGDARTDLLFYDPTRKRAEFFAVADGGKRELLAASNDWRSTWSQIVVGEFGGGGFSDLLLYDDCNRTGAFYRSDGNGRITLLAQHQNWRSDWSIIVAANFFGGSRSELLFYTQSSR